MATTVLARLVDWDMSSDRNHKVVGNFVQKRLVDWDMSSDRNDGVCPVSILVSLVDWDMSSDRNRCLRHRRTAPFTQAPAPSAIAIKA